MKKLLLIALIGILSLTSRAHADITWDWNYDTTSTADDEPDTYSGGGTLTTTSTPNIDGYFTVTSVTGTWTIDGTPYTITGLQAPGDGLIGLNDNLLSASSPQVTNNGFSFADSSGNLDVIFFSGGYYSAANGTLESVEGGDNIGDFSATAVPEPSQYGLDIFLAVAGFIAWRRFSARVA